VRALITGVTGQDGSYLAEQLVADGHEVYGMVRGQANPKMAWIQALVPGIRVVHGDLHDQSSLQNALALTQPDVVFNLGAATYVGMSWQQPTLMTEVTALGCLRVLEAIRVVNPAMRFVQASSSEMFGQAVETPQHETTPFNPRSPYGVAKVFAHHTTVNYRDSYGIHASTAIMFNHESPRRGSEFVTRKVTLAAARIAAGRQGELRLGNVDARRDWGWAPEYMHAVQRIAGQPEPGDYVLSTGEAHSVRDLCEVAFATVGLDYRDHVVVDPELLRPADVNILRGCSAKARAVLDWEPVVLFDEIVRRLVAHDMEVSSVGSSSAH
jgi:GDPmannose 4,6-dehydratase